MKYLTLILILANLTTSVFADTRKVKNPNALCFELEKIDQNEKDFNIPVERQRVFTIPADEDNLKELVLESGAVRCIQEKNGKWSAYSVK